mgnify:CR=1 FL=1
MCYNIKSTRLSRQHNNANIIALGARFLSNTTACVILEAFFNSKFEGGRHINRINQINNVNNINPITLEVEKKINNGTKQLFRSLEILTGAKPSADTSSVKRVQ